MTKLRVCAFIVYSFTYFEKFQFHSNFHRGLRQQERISNTTSIYYPISPPISPFITCLQRGMTRVKDIRPRVIEFIFIGVDESSGVVVLHPQQHHEIELTTRREKAVTLEVFFGFSVVPRDHVTNTPFHFPAQFDLIE